MDSVDLAFANTNAQVLLVTGGLDEYFGYLASTEVSLSSGK